MEQKNYYTKKAKETHLSGISLKVIANAFTNPDAAFNVPFKPYEVGTTAGTNAAIITAAALLGIPLLVYALKK